ESDSPARDGRQQRGRCALPPRIDRRHAALGKRALVHCPCPGPAVCHRHWPRPGPAGRHRTRHRRRPWGPQANLQWHRPPRAPAMTMTPAVRKLVLTMHVTLSVGWFGAIATFLVLSIAGLLSQDPETVRGVYLAMDLIGLLIIIPLSFAALATGLVQALGSP